MDTWEARAGKEVGSSGDQGVSGRQVRGGRWLCWPHEAGVGSRWE